MRATARSTRSALAPLGLRVILAEYPGYGPRAGALGEASFVADAEQTVALAHRQYGGPLLLVGESLGAAVAAAAAAQRRELTAGLLLITPWDRLAHVGAHHYPWLPVKWMLRDDYDSQARLAGFDRPVLVAVAEHDSIVPAALRPRAARRAGRPEASGGVRGRRPQRLARAGRCRLVAFGGVFCAGAKASAP